MVRAPAGWGKSTLLAEWHAARGRVPPLRLADPRPRRQRPRALLDLPHRGAAHPAPRRGRDLACPPSKRRGSTSSRTSSRRSATSSPTSEHGIVLVLDDYHLITNPQIQESVAAFVDHLPACWSSRSRRGRRPRCRSRGCGPGASSSRSTPRTSASGRGRGVAAERPARPRVGHDAVGRLQERTEGWAAGLYLASLTLRARSRLRRGVRPRVRGRRPARRRLPSRRGARSRSPRRCAPSSCGPRCSTASGRPCATRSPGARTRASSCASWSRPTSSSSRSTARRRWYRYHPLFAELLRQELALTEPASIGALHRRASAWHRDHGTASEAIRHATAAGDIADAATLILDHWIVARDRARMETILAWLAGLPTEAVTEDPRLALVKATTLQEIGRTTEADHWLEAAERRPVPPELRAGPDAVATGIAACRAINQYFHGDAGGIRRTASSSAGRGQRQRQRVSGTVPCSPPSAPPSSRPGRSRRPRSPWSGPSTQASRRATPWRSPTRWGGPWSRTSRTDGPSAPGASCDRSTTTWSRTRA